MNDMLHDAYHEADLPAPIRLTRLQDALTSMHDAMTKLSNRAAEIAAESDAGVQNSVRATALLRDVTSQQRKLAAKIVMLERIVASPETDSAF